MEAIEFILKCVRINKNSLQANRVHGEINFIRDHIYNPVRGTYFLQSLIWWAFALSDFNFPKTWFAYFDFIDYLTSQIQPYLYEHGC
jgi:hypothetical protein